ncbi:MAG: hypothetical protein JWN86_1913 [Planctomycetota bacterium]|nr:hypothetical protein [Planctomycetota bacterium]
MTSLALAALLGVIGMMAEPDYESACANWNPVQYQCTVLSPKYSQSKFVSPFRGGLHTVYVSEALGACPLIPGRARYMSRLPESIQILFATGETPDFRIAPRPDLRQHLFEGGLPLAVTNWESPDGTLHFHETAFVRQIGEAMEPARGDENAVAFVRLRVRNVSGKPQTAVVRLCVNRSNNGQPRGASAIEYGTGLRRDGDMLRNPQGQVRLLWKAPENASVEASLQAHVPTILEWDQPDAPPRPGAAREEKPFNRYHGTRANEDHSAFKAIDHQMMTFWTPDHPPGPRGLAIGLEFPEPRMVRQFAERYEGETAPAIDGYHLEYQDDGKWITIDDRLGGKAREALLASPEEQKKLGTFWIHTFDPVRAKRVRLVITAMPKGKEKPAIAEIEHLYRRLPEGSPWIETGAGDYLGDVVLFRVPIPANSSRDVTMCVPFLPCSEEESRWIAGRDPIREESDVAAYWATQRASGARIHVPEAAVQDAFDANIPHLVASTEIDPTNGLAITKTNVGWYEAIWPSLSASVILALDQTGHHRDAAIALEPFLKWQGTIKPPGQFHGKDGFFASADDYTWVRWVSGHGWILWAMAEHYRLSNDRVWLDRTLPNILAACDWIERERTTTRKDGPDGKPLPHWGLLPPGVTGDGAPNCHSFFGEASTWRGMDSAGAVLRSIGHPRAEEITAAAIEYRRCIENAMRWASKNSPPYKLKDGQTIPFIPIDVYNSFKINTGDPNWTRHPWWLDVGPLHAVDLGAIDPKSELALGMIRIAEDYWLKNGLALDEPFYAPQRAVYLGRDEIDKYLNVYYNLLAEGMDRQMHAPVEGHGGVQNLPWGDAEHIRSVRTMLVQEDGDGLSLARAIPRSWLNHGKRIVVERLPTHFGALSYAMDSDLLNKKITARITPPDRKPVPIHLRLRHPSKRKIRGVTVNGAPLETFDNEWIHLPASDKALVVVAVFE